jgi:hypothetical protein
MKKWDRLVDEPCSEVYKAYTIRRYSSSTFARAHGVLRKNFRLDLILGS